MRRPSSRADFRPFSLHAALSSDAKSRVIAKLFVISLTLNADADDQRVDSEHKVAVVLLIDELRCSPKETQAKNRSRAWLESHRAVEPGLDLSIHRE